MLAHTMTPKTRGLKPRLSDIVLEDSLAAVEDACTDADEPAEAAVGLLPLLPVVTAAKELSGHWGRAMTTGATSAWQVEPAELTIDSKELDH